MIMNRSKAMITAAAMTATIIMTVLFPPCAAALCDVAGLVSKSIVSRSVTTGSVCSVTTVTE